MVSIIGVTAVSGHTEATRAQESTEVQTRGPGNAQFPRNWRYGNYATSTRKKAGVRELVSLKILKMGDTQIHNNFL